MALGLNERVYVTPFYLKRGGVVVACSKDLYQVKHDTGVLLWYARDELHWLGYDAEQLPDGTLVRHGMRGEECRIVSSSVRYTPLSVSRYYTYDLIGIDPPYKQYEGIIRAALSVVKTEQYVMVIEGMELKNADGQFQNTV